MNFGESKELGRIEEIDFTIGEKISKGEIAISFAGSGWGVQGNIFHYTASGSGKEVAWDGVVSLLKKAKKSKLRELINTPVEVTFDETRRIKTFRVLEEVL